MPLPEELELFAPPPPRATPPFVLVAAALLGAFAAAFGWRAATAHAGVATAAWADVRPPDAALPNLLFLAPADDAERFLPVVFDARLHERGHRRVRSCRLAIRGLTPAGIAGVLGVLDDAPDGDLRWVLIAPAALEDLGEPADAADDRVRLDPLLAVEELAWLAGANLAPGPKLRRLGERGARFALDMANVSRGAPWVAALLRTRARSAAPEPAAGTVLAAGPALAEAGFAERVERHARTRIEADRLSDTGGRIFARLAGAVEALGAIPIFVVSPSLDQRGELVEAWRQERIAVLLRYDDPYLHPELYAPAARDGDERLNDAGARLFTEALAEDFADLLDGRR